MKSLLQSKPAALLGASALAIGLGLGVAPTANASVSGTVLCDTYTSTYSVVGVWINSSNNSHDGWASWTPVPGQPWKASFSKGDVNESYKVHVGCGGTPSNWDQTAYSQAYLTGYQDFICHVSFAASHRICSS